MTEIRLHQLHSEVRPDGTVLWTEKEIALELNEQGKVDVSLPVPQTFLAEFEEKLFYFYIDKNHDLYRIDRDAASQPHASKFTNEDWTPANINRLKLTLDWSVYQQAVEHLDLQRENSRLAIVCDELLSNILTREADLVQTIQLAGPNPEEYVREKVKRFHEDLLAAHQKKVVSELSHLLSSSPVSLKEALRNYVRAHEQFVKAQRLDYTAIPDHPVMLLFIELAKQLGKLYGVPPIQILLPDVCTYPETDESYPDLSKVDLAWVLKTHVLSHSHRYLLPVRLITTELGDHNDFYNPYYTLHDIDKSNAVITPEESSRLWRHSPKTEALKEIQDRYDLIVNDESTLLEQLTFLCKKFLEYGAHGGIGTQEKAAEPIFLILLQFFEYYDQLAQDTIPPEVCEKVNVIKEQLADSKSDKRGGIKTCIANHRTDLLPLIDKHKVTLGGISIDNAKRQSAIKEEGERLITARKELVESIEKFQYTGTDKLGLTCSMLTTLGVPLRINSFDDLALLYCFTPEELITLASDNHGLINDVKSYLNSIENLVLFLSTVLPTGHIAAFFSVFYPELKDPLQLNVLGNFRALIISLDPEKIAEICKVMKDHLPQIIKTGHGFSVVLHRLSRDQRTVVFEVTKGRWSDIIKTGDDVLNVLCYLLPSQCQVVCQAMKDQLPKIIKTIEKFVDILQYLSSQQGKVVCEVMKYWLPSIINAAYDFRSVVKGRTPEQKMVVLDAMKDQLPNIIKTVDDFKIVVQYLFPEQRTVVFEAMKAHWREIIKTAKDFRYFLSELFPDQRTLVFEVTKGRWSDIIKTGDDVLNVLCHLLPSQCQVVCQAMKDQLPKIIKTKEKFVDILQRLSHQQGKVVCEVMKYWLPSIINTAYDFRIVVNGRTSEQQMVVLDAMKDQLQEIIETVDDFTIVVQYLTPEQQMVVFDAMKDHLPKIIKTGENFGDVLRCLSPEECTAVFEAIGGHLLKIINSDLNIQNIFSYLCPEKETAVLKGMRNYLNKIGIRIDTGIDAPDKGNLIMDAWLKEAQRLHEINEKVEHLDSYMTGLSSESTRESNTSNKELITKDQNETINILTELDSDQRTTPLFSRSSMTASFFGPTTSPMNERLLLNISGEVPDFSSDNAAGDGSRLPL